MLGSINFSSESLTRVETFESLPEIGSSGTIYYIVDSNVFAIWDSNTNGYIKLKTRINMWRTLNDVTLKDVTQEVINIQLSDLESINENIAEIPALGDMVFDSYGASGNIIEVKQDSTVNVKTQQVNLMKKVSYADDSWEMWLPGELDGGHYYWDSKTNILEYEKFNRDSLSTIVYEKCAINAGGPNYVITGGTRVGTREFIAWSGESKGSGSLKCYYTKDGTDDTFTSNNEVATIGDIYSILSAESGIYCGYAETERALNEGILVGGQADHELSNNDWAYVMHYAQGVLQYDDESLTSFSAESIIEYNYQLFKVAEDFEKTNWADDNVHCFEYDGSRYSFIYRKSGEQPGEWTIGMEVEPDIPEPDDVALTINPQNKSTIKNGGVVTSHLSDSCVTTQKIADLSVTNQKIVNATIAKSKLDSSLQGTVTKAETCWYSDNLIVSKEQPVAPTNGYIIWIDCDLNSL